MSTRFGKTGLLYCKQKEKMKDQYIKVKYDYFKLMKFKEIGYNEILLLCLIKNLSQKQVCTASNEYLSNILGMKERTLQRSLKNLRTINLIKTREERQGVAKITTCRYIYIQSDNIEKILIEETCNINATYYPAVNKSEMLEAHDSSLTNARQPRQEDMTKLMEAHDNPVTQITNIKDNKKNKEITNEIYEVESVLSFLAYKGKSSNNNITDVLERYDIDQKYHKENIIKIIEKLQRFGYKVENEKDLNFLASYWLEEYQYLENNREGKDIKISFSYDLSVICEWVNERKQQYDIEIREEKKKQREAEAEAQWKKEYDIKVKKAVQSLAVLSEVFKLYELSDNDIYRIEADFMCHLVEDAIPKDEWNDLSCYWLSCREEISRSSDNYISFKSDYKAFISGYLHRNDEPLPF